jgi:hypothetical protein
VAAGAGGCGFGFRPHAALPTAAIRTTAAHTVNLRIIKLFSSSCLHVATNGHIEWGKSGV